MELTLTFLATGCLIIIYNLWRARRLDKYSKLTDALASEFDVSNIDKSGQTAYTNCTSHKWIIDSLGRKKHGKLGGMLQERLFDNTLASFIWIAFFLGSGALVFGILLIRSIEIAGMSIFVLFVGVLVILGPGDTKVSEELLIELSNHEVDELCEEDYVYADLALDSIRRWIITALVIGFIITIISPWAEIIPVAVAGAVAIISTFLIWNPALFLSQISLPLAIAYLAVVIPLMFYGFVLLFRRIRQENDDSKNPATQW